MAAHDSPLDRERRGMFLEKADIVLPDGWLAGLRSASEASLGINGEFLESAASAFGVEQPSSITPAVEQGTFHRLYDMGQPGRSRRLLRVAVVPGPAWVGRMRLEQRLTTSLRERDLPVPPSEFRAVESDGQVRGVHLLDRVNGVSLTQIDADEEQMAAALEVVTRFLVRLHQIPGEGFGPLSDEDGETSGRMTIRGVHSAWADYVVVRLPEHLQASEASGAVTAAEVHDIRLRFDAAADLLREPEPSLLHGDPGSHNFLVDDGKVSGVIDWEDALAGDPLFDLASLCTFQPERRHAAIWAAYGADPRADRDAWRRFWLYYLRIALAKTVHRLRFAYADHPDRPPASRRIQLALARLDEGV